MGQVDDATGNRPGAPAPGDQDRRFDEMAGSEDAGHRLRPPIGMAMRGGAQQRTRIEQQCGPEADAHDRLGAHDLSRAGGAKLRAEA